MTVVKCSRILELIERLHRQSGLERTLKTELTLELIRISIRAMLEELQPKFCEEDLRRMVDFGHESGNIIEAKARHELPHGEYIAIGMAISSSIGHQKGKLARVDLERILNCLLDIRLPIVATHHDRCNANVLWTQISTDGLR